MYLAGNKMQFKDFKQRSNVTFIIYKNSPGSYMEGKLERARLFLKVKKPSKSSLKSSNKIM